MARIALLISLMLVMSYSAALAAPAEEFYLDAEYPQARVLEKNFCKAEPTCKYLGRNESFPGTYTLYFMQHNKLAYDIVTLYKLDTGYWVMEIRGGWKGLLLR